VAFVRWTSWHTAKDQGHYTAEINLVAAQSEGEYLRRLSHREKVNVGILGSVLGLGRF